MFRRIIIKAGLLYVWHKKDGTRRLVFSPVTVFNTDGIVTVSKIALFTYFTAEAFFGAEKIKKPWLIPAFLWMPALKLATDEDLESVLRTWSDPVMSVGQWLDTLETAVPKLATEEKVRLKKIKATL